jgi:hypothetical protein
LLAGAVPAALMALGADFILGSLETHFSIDAKSDKRRGSPLLRRIGLVLTATVIAILAIAFWVSARRPAKTGANARAVVVASKDFTESALLYRADARGHGLRVERQFELGGNLPHEGLVAGRIDLIPNTPEQRTPRSCIIRRSLIRGLFMIKSSVSTRQSSGRRRPTDRFR